MKTIKYLLLISYLILVSCQNKNDGEINIYTKKDSLNFKSFTFYTDRNGNLYLNLKDDFNYDEQIIEKIEFVKDEKIYTILPVKLYFSREFPNSDFIFFRDNLTLKTELRRENKNQKMILIWPRKTEYDSLIKHDIIKPIKLN